MFSDCEVAIDMNYNLIRESHEKLSIKECKKQYDELLLRLQAEYSEDEVAMSWVKWDKFEGSINIRKYRSKSKFKVNEEERGEKDEGMSYIKAL